MDSIAQQARILYILKILKMYSSEEHSISQTEILKHLSAVGINCDRKTVARNIDALIKFGYDIIKISGGGCYINDEKFDDSELTFLIDCIYSSPALSQKQAEAIIEKLTKDIDFEKKKKFKNIYKATEMNRTINNQLFYNIDKINRAIQNNKQISFYYNIYSKDKKLKPRKEGKYIINPYFTINSRGKYFLVCNKDNYDNISNYRIDYITYIDILTTPRKEINLIKDGMQIINPTKYVNEHIYMFSGNSKKFVLKLSNEKVVSDIIDWFGRNVTIVENKEGLFAKLTTNENAIIYWIMQYGEDVELIEPYEMREKIKIILTNILQKYDKE